ncbi:unnamed protein product, partial [Discosporangium mesarthrocarpum]
MSSRGASCHIGHFMLCQLRASLIDGSTPHQASERVKTLPFWQVYVWVLNVSRSMRKTGSRQDSSDEDHHDDNLRTTCDGCTISKVKCDGGHPCKRCVRKELTCIYREKLRCGPKRRRYERDEEDDDNGVLWVSSSDNRLRARILSGQEREYLKTFCKSVNKSIPITSMIVVRDAMNPLPLEVLEATASVTEAERHIFHARKAVLLGAVALGAVYSGDSDAGAPYMEQAHKHLKDCFDALLPEVVSCYLIMVMFHIHSLEKSKVFRYIGFAQQAFQELSRSQRAGAVNVRDSLVMLSTFLHVTCDSNIQVEQIEVGARDKEEGKAGGAGITCIPSQVLVTFSYVLLFLSRLTDQVIKAKAPPEAFPLPTLAELANMVDEANRLVGMLDDPGVMTTIVIKTLRGYFMLMSIALRETGGHQEGVGRAMQGGEEKEERLNEEKVVKEVGIPVADALDADQGVLHFPLCWQLCRSVSAFLRLKGQVERADGMDHHMSAIKDKVPFADICSSIILRVFHTYVGPNPSSRGVEPPRAGLFTHSSSPQVGRGCPEGTVDTLVTRWQKKRTCHTRGGDIGPIARGISTWASSIPCTDRGHSRSGTNPQTPDMVRHGSATVSGGAAAAATAIDTRPWTTAAAAAAAPLSTAFQQLAVAGDRAGEAASGKPPWDQRGMKADKRSLVLPQGTG